MQMFFQSRILVSYLTVLWLLHSQTSFPHIEMKSWNKKDRAFYGIQLPFYGLSEDKLGILF